MIRITDVHKTYQSGDTAVHALRGVSLLIEPGEFLAIAGPSGSGKSTLLNIAGCLDSPDSGTIRIHDQDIHQLTVTGRATYRREHLGFIFQSFNLVPVMTAYENIALPLELLGLPAAEIHERTQRIITDVGLAGMEDRRPGRLSGGQQQRVAIARALIKEPAIVLADEPTANLDSTTGEAVLELMRQLNEERHTTFLFSTHDPKVMDFSRRLVQLQDGEIVRDERKRL
jgi:putative ABC transport system ATP-binding protein